MKKIKLYDYQQEMLGNVTKVLTGPSLGGFFYNERGKRVKSANSFFIKGIIDKYGYVVVPAEYRSFIFLTENSVLGITGKGGTDTIML